MSENKLEIKTQFPGLPVRAIGPSDDVVVSVEALARWIAADRKAQATALLERLPQSLDDRDKNLEVPTAFKNGHNHALERVRSIINEELEKLG